MESWLEKFEGRRNPATTFGVALDTKPASRDLSTPSSVTMLKKGVDISFIKPAMDNDDWKREVTDVEKCLVIVEVYSSKWGACVHLDGHYQALYYDKVPLLFATQLGAILSHSAQFL